MTPRLKTTMASEVQPGGGRLALAPAPKEVLDVEVLSSHNVRTCDFWTHWMNTSPESEFVPGTAKVEATAKGYTVTGRLKGQIRKVDFAMEVLI